LRRALPDGFLGNAQEWLRSQPSGNGPARVGGVDSSEVRQTPVLLCDGAAFLPAEERERESERRDPCGSRKNRGKPSEGSPTGEEAPPSSERPDSCELRKNPSGRVRLRGRAPVRTLLPARPSRRRSLCDSCRSSFRLRDRRRWMPPTRRPRYRG
jgi:hypothetical protein